MAIEPGDIIQSRVNFTLQDGVRGMNVYNFMRTDASPDIMDDAVCVSLIASQIALMFATIDNDIVDTCEWTTLESDVMLWNPGPQAWQVSRNLPDVDLSLQGASVAEMLPHQNAGVIVADTDIVRCSPKKFIAGLSEHAQNGGKLVFGVLQDLANFAALWSDVIAASNFLITPGTISKVGWFVNLGAMFVNEVVGSQRRRKIGSGM